MSFDIVFFGGTGDLAWRKLMPAMFQAFRHGALPGDGRILTAAREGLTTETYKPWLLERFNRLSWGDEPFTPAEFDQFIAMVEYMPLDLSKDATYKQLRGWVDKRQADAVVMYLATAPQLFTSVCEGLAKVGLNESRVRVVLEKPLGHDLESATAINSAVQRVFSEKQIFRIDHYLGKQSVQNLMALRFGNSLFEPLWRREWISNVQITLAEDLGVEQRGGYYDKSGALRDMVQNHLLQLLCMVAMEPPASDDADAVRDEKLKVLRSLQPYKPHQVEQFVVRGQYRAGSVNGHAVPGYLEETGVPEDSHTETFVSLRAEINNWRWAGVPFFLRTGKRMANRGAEIVINFRSVPHAIFDAPMGMNHNRLVIRLQPEDTIELHLLAKASNRGKAEQGRLTPVKLDLDFREAFGKQTIEGYERLLRKVIAGRLDLFVRFDEQQAAWKWVEPILEAWQNDNNPPRPYAAGTWGPAASSALTARDNVTWPEEQ
jgi:glucose-6-phosphate 1-dehydrogenase